MRPTSAALRLQVESALAGRVISPFRLREPEPTCTAPTGIPALDESTGGLPRGSLTEIYGPVSSGKTSILLSTLAGRTRNAEVCALVDAQDAFDPNVAQTAGVHLEQVLWVRCRSLDQALRSTDLLLHGGGFGLIALDLADAPARAVHQIPLNVWFRLRRAVESTPTILLVLSQESNAKTCASLVLRLQKETTSWSLHPRNNAGRIFHTPSCLLEGWTSEAEIVRTRIQRAIPHYIDIARSSVSCQDAGKIVRFAVCADPRRENEPTLPVPSRARKKERKQNPG
jgi:recombination protein RecA